MPCGPTGHSMGSRRAEPLPAAALLLALLVPAVAVAQSSGAQSSSAKTIYCCDVGTQPVCGDILPAACYGRAYREISPSGTVRRVVPAPLTAEEIARRDAEERRRRAEDAQRLKQLRLDQALLETYRSLEDLDSRRDRELADLDRTLRELRQREAELLERQRGLIEEAARDAGGQPAAGVDDDIRSLDGEIVAQRSIIDAKLRERSAVLDRFEEDRARYLQLTSPVEPAPAR